MGRPSPREAARRLGVLIFGSALVILFIVLAIAEGIGDPDIPSGDVILVEDAPGDGGKISKAKFDHALELAATQSGQKKAPKPGTPKYDELKEAAVTGLLEAAWLEGQGAEMGITVSDREITKEFAKLKKENFPKESDFKKFIKESGFTDEDIDERVKLQILSTEIQERLQNDAPDPSESEIEDYYETAKSAQYTEAASRDVRLILNKEEEKVEKARTMLEEGKAEKDWDRIAKEYSEDPASKEKGGLQTGVTEAAEGESLLEEPLSAAVFDAPVDQLEGPIKGDKGFYLFEVVKATPERTQPLADVRSTISSTLEQQLQQQYFEQFVNGFTSRWTSRTFCASGYVVDRCENFEPAGRPAEANPACYEANPKGGPPEEGCPASVLQVKPALPGSVDVLKPAGDQLAQRPQPAGLKPAPEGASLEGLPPGVSIPGE